MIWVILSSDLAVRIAGLRRVVLPRALKGRKPESLLRPLLSRTVPATEISYGVIW